MIRNYLKVAWRNLIRNRVFSTINILGLALGMACSILIILWVQNELGIDSFHANDSRLYTVYERQYYDHKVHGLYSTPGILADEMKKVLPDVQFAVNVDMGYQNTFEVKDKIIKMPGGFAGADYFKMFSYPMVLGTAQAALNTPSSIAISRKMAEAFFGSPQAALGKSIRYENKENFNVAAVFENIPEAASEKFDYVINWFQLLKENPWAKTWDSNSPACYIMLKPQANATAFDKKITHFIDTYNKPTAAFHEELGIQKFSDVYLNGNIWDGYINGGRVEYVRLFSIVAVFILLIACINFMNLTTACLVFRVLVFGVCFAVGVVCCVL